MPEPTTTAAGITLAAATASVPVLTAFGISLGLRVDVLVAGFAGALVAIALLGAVPADGDTWQAMVRTTFRRLGVALASSLTAGYLTPLALLVANLPDGLLLAVAFGTGAGAQKVLRSAIDRISPRPLEQGGKP
jgi:zinc transporter ZupT